MLSNKGAWAWGSFCERGCMYVLSGSKLEGCITSFHQMCNVSFLPFSAVPHRAVLWPLLWMTIKLLRCVGPLHVWAHCSLSVANRSFI